MKKNVNNKKLSFIFKQAEDELKDVTRRSTKTQEVLVYKNKYNFAWRPLSSAQNLQIFPPTKNRVWYRSDDQVYFIIEAAKGTFKYYDPKSQLKGDQWSYVGCNVDSIDTNQIWNWIVSAHNNIKSVA